VNLIGEHIDYSGYGVLPMAISMDTVVAISKQGSSLRVRSPLPEKYPNMEFSSDPAQAVDTENHSWANYFVCAYKGVQELLKSQGVKPPSSCGLETMIHGIVPTGSGLSSSAALICSSMLAILSSEPFSDPHSSLLSKVNKGQVADAAAKAERYVGVASGGMDQAISMMAINGVAKQVEFNPIRAMDVVLPPGATFVVANSLAVSDKAVGAHRRYNMRVIECRLAAIVLALALGKDAPSALSSVKMLKDVEPLVAEKYGGGSPGSIGLLAMASQAVKNHLHEGRYTLEEIEGLIGVKVEKVYEDSPVSLKVLLVAREDGGLLLRDRALHVFDEAARVLRFAKLCNDAAAAGGGGEEDLKALGSLMDASHESCSKLFGCSCPELEDLVAAARSCGSLGARLTGAGWGGCCVFLVREPEADKFIADLKASFYEVRVKSGMLAPMTEEEMKGVIFASKPASGAAVISKEGLKALIA
jgi:N-acetylgalactosamine kinase